MKKILIFIMFLPLLCKAQQYNRDSLEQIVEKNMQLDSIKSSDEYLNQLYPAIMKSTTNALFRERLMADATIDILSMNSSEDPKPFVEKYLANSQTDSLRYKVNTCYAKFLKKYGPILPGKTAPDFSFTDSNGKTLHVSDLRGKTLLIDIWGTWCAPCIAEMPYIEKLQQRYASNNKIHIMSIACDKKIEKWKSFLTAHKTSWHQYIITPEGDKILDDIYHVYGIPRFIIIDKEGKIVSSDTLRPSEDEFDKYFNDITNK
ncbi:MAG TPA: TlpA disulfide reductase family protein [Xylanibacter oryzae]|nr:TlpA disulfide reductase family protein [Xylanibacter oryzae]